jgi:hypothetical protein
VGSRHDVKTRGRHGVTKSRCSMAVSEENATLRDGGGEDDGDGLTAPRGSIDADAEDDKEEEEEEEEEEDVVVGDADGAARSSRARNWPSLFWARCRLTTHNSATCSANGCAWAR